MTTPSGVFKLFQTIRNTRVDRDNPKKDGASQTDKNETTSHENLTSMQELFTSMETLWQGSQPILGNLGKKLLGGQPPKDLSRQTVRDFT